MLFTLYNEVNNAKTMLKKIDSYFITLHTFQ